MVHKHETHTPFCPTSVGTKFHDIRLRQLPAYSIGAKSDIKTKCYSPGPAAYPKDDGKKGYQVPKSIYPEDKAFKYSIGSKGKEVKNYQTPSPAAHPLDRDGKGKKEIISIYPKENANKFSIGGRREQKNPTKSPGPAIYPRDIDTSNNINSLHPIEKANKFTMCPRPNTRTQPMSPGPAQYPVSREEAKNKVPTIYPTDTRLLPTIKERYEIKNKQQAPSPNTYPMLEDTGSSKRAKSDLTKKMIPGKRSPLYSIGIKHSPKQHMLILKEDQF